MTHKGCLLAGVVLVVASAPLFTSGISMSPRTLTPHRIFEGGWEALYGHHRPGYLLDGVRQGGDVLAPGVYRYDFYFALRPGHFSSLLSGANDVVRLEVADTTSGTTLVSRTLQQVDFPSKPKTLSRKSLLFSVDNPHRHRFEPRVYWPGLSGVFLQRVELVAEPRLDLAALEKKASDFEAMMPAVFLDRGMVILQDGGHNPSDLGDTAIWTGLYAVAEAFCYQETQDPEALRRMEKSLSALHRLVQASPLPGTMARAVDSDGQPLEEPASKDVYTGFFYAAARAMPFIKNKTLKKDLLKDVDALATHLLDHDLTFESPYGSPVELSPTLGNAFIANVEQDLQRDPHHRRALRKLLRLARAYFWIHGQRIPSSFIRLQHHLKHPESLSLKQDLPALLSDIPLVLKMLQKNVHRSALRGAREQVNDTPYGKLDLLLLRALNNLDEEESRGRRPKAQDFKILPSESMHALHFIKVAAELLPKPNRFDRYYEENLYDGKALLRTLMQWHQIDEDVVAAALGQTEAGTRRTASCHLSFLALEDLIRLEKDPHRRFQYQKLFEAQYVPMRQDGNAMIDAMEADIGLSTPQRGLAWHSLALYPTDRRGKGERYWREHREELLANFDGEVNDQAREPLPVDLRPRDAFLWQRSAHSIRGDHEGWLYPPLDYLFAYWLARTAVPSERLQDQKNR